MISMFGDAIRRGGSNGRWRFSGGKSSGQSVRAFCRQAGLKESAFLFWRRELALQDRAAPFATIASVRLTSG